MSWVRTFDYRTSAEFWGITNAATAFRVHAVVGGTPAAIVSGNTSQAAVAQALGREQRSVQHPLRALEDTGFVVASDDALRSRRPIYRIADPIVRFHHVVTRRDLARFEDRRTFEAWEDAQPRFRTHVL